MANTIYRFLIPLNLFAILQSLLLLKLSTTRKLMRS